MILISVTSFPDLLELRTRVFIIHCRLSFKSASYDLPALRGRVPRFVYLSQFSRSLPTQFTCPLSARYTFTRRILHIPCSCVPRPCAAIFTSLFCTFHVYASGTRKCPNLFLIFCGNVGKSVIKWQSKERNYVRNRNKREENAFIIYTACGAGLFDGYTDRKRKARSRAFGTGRTFSEDGSLFRVTAGAGAGDSILLYEGSRDDCKDTGLAGGI